jgi:hypothetical protein
MRVSSFATDFQSDTADSGTGTERRDSEKPTRGIHYRGSHSKRARADLIVASYMSASGTAMARGHRLQVGSETAVQLC